MNWGAGLLQAVGSGGAGGFKAVQDNNKTELERIKLAAAQLREDFLNNQAHGWRKEEIEGNQAFQSQERQAGQDFTAGQSQEGRDFSAKQAQIGRDFTAGQGSLERDFKKGENDLNRQSTLGAADLKYQRDIDLALIKNSGADSGQAKAALDGLKFSYELLQGGSNIEQVNEARLHAGFPPLIEEISGVKDGSFFSKGRLDTKLVPQIPSRGDIEGNSSSDFTSIFESTFGKNKDSDKKNFNMIEYSQEFLPVEEQPGLLAEPKTDKPTSRAEDIDNLVIGNDGKIYHMGGKYPVLVKAPPERLNTGIREDMGGNIVNPEYVEYLELLEAVRNKSKKGAL